MRVVLKDCSENSKDFVVHPKVFSELKLLPGDVALCKAETSCYVRLWPKEMSSPNVCECGKLLLAQIGVCLGDSVLLEAPEAPLRETKRICIEDDSWASFHMDDLTHALWTWVRHSSR